MGTVLRLRRQGRETHELELADPRAGTSLALGFPLFALFALSVWLHAGLPQPTPTFWTLFVLPLACAVYGAFPLLLDRRMHVTFEQPTIVLAGLVGGPLVGVVAGAAAGLGDAEAVWRRRAAFAGLAMLQGFAAGVAGVAWQSARIGLPLAIAVASIACFVVGGAGFSLVMLVRRCWSLERLRHLLAVDAAELVVAAPLLWVFALSLTSSPAAASLAVASTLVLVGLGARTLSIERARAERVREAYLVDARTGALSRAGFEEILAREHARVLRGEQPAGILVCDLDCFGHLNEELGHLGGDQVLGHVVERMKDAVRAADCVARWGGDELCVLAPRAGSLDDVRQLAERVRQAVAESPIEVGDVRTTVTISVGATLLTDAAGTEQAFARADEALYLAKRERNTICVLPPSDPAPALTAVRPARAVTD